MKALDLFSFKLYFLGKKALLVNYILECECVNFLVSNVTFSYSERPISKEYNFLLMTFDF